MSTNKNFDKIAILLICLALVSSLLIALTWTSVESSYAMNPSINDLTDITGYVDLDNEGGDVSILVGGTYYISGTLSDGQITVDVDDSEYVILIFAGVSINCSDGSAVYIANSGNCAVYLEEGTENYICSGTVRLDDKSKDKQFIDTDATGGAIVFKDNATICGDGSLTVCGYINNGIHCSNDLFIEAGTINVLAVNNGIKGKDNLVIDGGDISIAAGNAGLKSGESGDSNSGCIIINGGKINITKSYEGMEANQITINDGETYIAASDDGINACGGSNSFGGMGKADAKQMPDFSQGFSREENNGGDASMNNDFSGNSNEDHIVKPEHSSDKSGLIPESTDAKDGHGMKKGGFDNMNKAKPDGMDDAVSSGSIERNKDDNTVHMMEPENNTSTKAFEGAEPADRQNDRDIKFGSMQGDDADTSENTVASLIINGGYLYICADGDGLDSNGDLIVNGGTVIVDGPTNSGNGALDSGSENGGHLLVNGGTLIAVGASGMAEVPEDESEQNSISCNTSFNANDRITVSDENGNVIFEYNVAKTGSSIVFSSKELEIGITYTICVGNNAYDIELTDTVTKASFM